MPPLNSVLIPHSSLSDHNESFNILIKLNSDILQNLKQSILQDQASLKPKLIIKNGEYFIKLNNGEQIIKSKRFNETSRIDLFANNSDDCLNLGKVDMRLNLLLSSGTTNNTSSNSRLKKIQSIERPRSELSSSILKNNSNINTSQSLPSSPNLKLVSSSSSSSSSSSDNDEDDNEQDDPMYKKIRRLVHLLSLGPRSVGEINNIIKINPYVIKKYGQIWDSNDDLKYPYYSDSKDLKYVLKFENYKKLSLHYYQEDEKKLILVNLNKILQKTGYDLTNSTRLNITKQFDPILEDLKKLKTQKLQKMRDDEKRKIEEENKKAASNISAAPELHNKKEAKKKTSPPPLTLLIAEEKKRKRTISDSSASSVNSMKYNAESPITSQEEMNDDIALNDLKRRQKRKPAEPELSEVQIELLKKFNSTYADYYKLYQFLQDSKKLPSKKTYFKKLMVLENEVKVLKKKLWQ